MPLLLFELNHHLQFKKIMAQLSSVIGSILRDIISAQHEANLYSLALSENYGKDGKVKDFQLPGVFISDMELELKYGVISSDENQQQFNIKYNKFRRFVKSLCTESAKTAITTAVSTVLSSDIERDEEDLEFFRRLKKEEDLNRNFQSFLSNKMRSSLGNGLYEAVDHSTGAVIVDVVVRKLMDAATRKFLDDRDLDSLFEGNEGKALKETLAANMQEALTGLVEKLSEGMNFKRVKVFPRLDVAVTADELSKMPEEAIHVFKLKFSPTTCNITEIEDEEELDEFDMKHL